MGLLSLQNMTMLDVHLAASDLDHSSEPVVQFCLALASGTRKDDNLKQAAIVPGTLALWLIAQYNDVSFPGFCKKICFKMTLTCHGDFGSQDIL